MAISEKIFLEELYTEHLEEAAFLYETRLAWLTDNEVGWQDLSDLDNRLEAHIDALVVGDTMALGWCWQQLPDADYSTLHAIVRVLCRYKSVDYLARLWPGFDFDDRDKVRAVADAFKWECPREWYPHILAAFSGGKPELFPVLAPSVVCCGLDAGATLASALPLAKLQDVKTLLWAVSKTIKRNNKQLVSSLLSFVKDDDKDVREQAAYGVLRAGDGTVLNYLRPRAADFSCLLAISGSEADLAGIRQVAEKGLADENCLLALGLGGEIQAVNSLIGYLKHPDFSSTAALALNLISGANLYEEIYEADDVSEDELFEAELKAYKKGVLPKNIDGKPYGSQMRQLCVDGNLWLDWFRKNQSRFAAGLRYRNGKLLSLMEAVNNLISNQTPYRVRQLVYEELEIRFGLDLPFEADDLVIKQQAHLNAIYQWAQQKQSRFIEGRWYFFGAPC